MGVGAGGGGDPGGCGQCTGLWLGVSRPRGRLPGKCWPPGGSQGGASQPPGTFLGFRSLISSSRDSHKEAHPQGQRRGGGRDGGGEEEGEGLGTTRDVTFISAAQRNGHVPPRQHYRFTQQRVLAALWRSHEGRAGCHPPRGMNEAEAAPLLEVVHVAESHVGACACVLCDCSPPGLSAVVAAAPVHLPQHSARGSGRTFSPSGSAFSL